MVLEHSKVAFQVDTQVSVKQASVFVVVALAVAAVLTNAGLPSHVVIVALFVGSANHPMKFVTTVGLVLADSSLDNGNWNPAGLAIFVEIQHLYMLYWEFHLVLNPNLVFLGRTNAVRSIVDHPAIVLTNGFFLDNLFVHVFHQIDGPPLDGTDLDTQEVGIYMV